jgi:hypothetical protein
LKKPSRVRTRINSRTRRGTSRAGHTGRKERGERLEKGRSWDEVRPGRVAQGRELVKDPAYPSPKVIRSIARLLAGHLA